MKKAFLLVVILFVSVISTACINNLAVQELNNKAKDYLDKGDFENAISRLKSSVDLDSTIFETHYNLGIAYTQAEKYPEAVETFQNAIKLKPDFADAYYSLAVAQENYAKGIIDNTIDISGKNIEKDKDSLKTNEEGLLSKTKKIAKEEKAKITELFNNAKSSYQAYLKKGKEIEDRQDVESKIEYLEKTIKQYASEEEANKGE